MKHFLTASLNAHNSLLWVEVLRPESSAIISCTACFTVKFGCCCCWCCVGVNYETRYEPSTSSLKLSLSKNRRFEQPVVLNVNNDSKAMKKKKKSHVFCFTYHEGWPPPHTHHKHTHITLSNLPIPAYYSSSCWVATTAFECKKPSHDPTPHPPGQWHLFLQYIWYE